MENEWTRRIAELEAELEQLRTLLVEANICHDVDEYTQRCLPGCLRCRLEPILCPTPASGRSRAIRKEVERLEAVVESLGRTAEHLSEQAADSEIRAQRVEERVAELGQEKARAYARIAALETALTHREELLAQMTRQYEEEIGVERPWGKTEAQQRAD